jgi:hypothetical protein
LPIHFDVPPRAPKVISSRLTIQRAQTLSFEFALHLKHELLTSIVPTKLRLYEGWHLFWLSIARYLAKFCI